MASIASEQQDDFVHVLPKQPQPSGIPEVFRLPTLKGHNLFEIDVSEIQHLYSIKAFTVKEYVQFCLEHIQRTNFYLEAVIETNPDALSIAEGLDGEISKKGTAPKGALWGIPVLLKDSMATQDKMETCAGSWALLGSKVPKDAFIVKRLRKAGAIILGKTNLDEWAGMRCIANYSVGYSARGGQCRNPYRLSRSPEGSSSGSAVTVSSNIVPLAFGTETDTSIIGPGLVNGVVAIKPTVGLTSRTGIVPISNTQDSIGPYGRCVADAAVALDVIAGPDEDDEFSTVPGRRQPSSYLEHLTDRHALKGAKFGLPIKRFWDVAPQPQKRVAENLIALLKDAGAEIIDVDMPCAEERIHPDGHWDWTRYSETNPAKSELTVSKVQTYKLMKKYLASLTNTSMRTLEDIVRFNDQNSGSEGGLAGTHPAFPTGQDLFRDCVKTQGKEDHIYKSALSWIRKQTRENGIDAVLSYTDPKTKEKTSLDALLFCDIQMGGTCIAAQAGYPVVSIPVGLDPEGMPVGITLIHTAWEEARLLKWASAIEDLMMHHCEQRQEGATGSASVPDMLTDQPVGRVPPSFKEHLKKNVPVDYGWTYASKETAAPLRPGQTISARVLPKAVSQGMASNNKSSEFDIPALRRLRLVNARWRIPGSVAVSQPTVQGPDGKISQR
jgi:amidase